jgi:hypothetical protein
LPSRSDVERRFNVSSGIGLKARKTLVNRLVGAFGELVNKPLNDLFQKMKLGKKFLGASEA